MLNTLIRTLFSDGKRNWKGDVVSVLFSSSFFLFGYVFSSYISKSMLTILVSMSIASAGISLIIGRLEGLGYKPFLKIEKWLSKNQPVTHPEQSEARDKQTPKD